MIYDCTAYVNDPDSAGSLGSGPSLNVASMHAVGTGNNNILCYIFANKVYRHSRKRMNLNIGIVHTHENFST